MMNHFEHKMPQDGGGGNPNNLRWVASCPLCGAEYLPEEARIVSEKDGAFLVHTNCKKCGSSVLATLVANQMGVSSVGLVTDLTYEDVIKFKDSSRLSADDVLSLYEALEVSDDFEDLFSK